MVSGYELCHTEESLCESRLPLWGLALFFQNILRELLISCLQFMVYLSFLLAVLLISMVKYYCSFIPGLRFFLLSKSVIAFYVLNLFFPLPLQLNLISLTIFLSPPCHLFSCSSKYFDHSVGYLLPSPLSYYHFLSFKAPPTLCRDSL